MDLITKFNKSRRWLGAVRKSNCSLSSSIEQRKLWIVPVGTKIRILQSVRHYDDGYRILIQWHGFMEPVAHASY